MTYALYFWLLLSPAQAQSVTDPHASTWLLAWDWKGLWDLTSFMAVSVLALLLILVAFEKISIQRQARRRAQGTKQGH
ncbi:MAG: hypothetical protein HC904_17255 [Blastochloris sp.]|nr:hypothetical protein [Blastochloris sp.]